MSYGGNYGGGGGGYGGQQNPYNQDNYGDGGRGYDGSYGGASPPGGRYGAQPEVEMQPYDATVGDRTGGGLPTGPRPGGAGLPSGPGPRMGAPGGGGYGGPDAGGYGGAGGDDILNSCQAIDKAVDDLERRLFDLQGLHSRVLSDRASNSEVDRSNSEMMAAYRNLGDKLKKVKSNPESGSPRNAPQVGRVDRKLKKAINDYQRVESDFRKQMQEQQARQYRIVRPDATEAEVREAVEEPNAQVFQQALLSSDRRGQSQTAMNAVRQRHNEIQRIEQTIVELAELFQDLDVIVQEQEPLIQNIEQKGEEVHENVVKANEELAMGVKSARGARKKKWICFWIVVVLIILIAIIVGVYIAVNKPFANKNPAPAPTATVTKTPRIMRRAALMEPHQHAVWDI